MYFIQPSTHDIAIGLNLFARASRKSRKIRLYRYNLIYTWHKSKSLAQKFDSLRWTLRIWDALFLILKFLIFAALNIKTLNISSCFQPISFDITFVLTLLVRASQESRNIRLYRHRSIYTSKIYRSEI